MKHLWSLLAKHLNRCSFKIHLLLNLCNHVARLKYSEFVIIFAINEIILLHSIPGNALHFLSALRRQIRM